MFTADYSFESPDSSAVRSVAWNSETSTLRVKMKGSNASYDYSNVPFWRFRDFENADSKGTFYATVVKRNYGPGERVLNTVVAGGGQVGGTGIVGGTLTVTPETVVSGNGNLRIGSNGGLSFAGPANVANYHSLSVAEPEKSAGERYTVRLEIGGETKDADFDAESEAGALEQLNHFAGLLGVTLKVLSVTHHLV